MITVERKVQFGQGRGSRKKARLESSKGETPTGCVPRVAKLMALAIRFDQLIREGMVADQAELARIGLVSRARISQIMNLLNCAPEIQEELLYLSTPPCGRQPITEKRVRQMAGAHCWSRQRHLWKNEVARS